MNGWINWRNIKKIAYNILFHEEMKIAFNFQFYNKCVYIYPIVQI